MPKIIWRQRDVNPGRALYIDPRALYYPVPVCPKCGSDAITPIKEG